MAVNSKAWRRFPIAARETTFDADDAITRVANVSAGSVETFNTAFLWRNEQAPPNNKNSYRLPVVDIINNRFTLIPRAVFTAAAILSGAHGGLEGVVGEDEKKQLRAVVSEIYSVLRDAYSDPRVVPPWERNDTPPNERPNRQITAAGVLNGEVAMLPVGPDVRWKAEAARQRLRDWAAGDIRKYRQAFLWWDAFIPDARSSYRFPVADVVDGELKLMPQAVVTAAGLMQYPDSLDVPDEVRGDLAALVASLQTQLQEGAAPMSEDPLLRPPAEWFNEPRLDGPTPLTVTADGRVYGHLALWNVCHFGIGSVCQMAPRTAHDYKFFANGHVLTADGQQVRVGRITVGTGHASKTLGYIPAADHYDNTGTAVAVVAAGEDQFGIWVAGSVAPGVPEHKVAELRRSPLSGDWRRVGSNLELVAALAVNNPGFPVMGFTASGEQMSLLAAGMVLTDEDKTALGVGPDVPQEQKDQQTALALRLAEFERRSEELGRVARRRRFNAAMEGR